MHSAMILHDRPYQDVGYDGLTDTAELKKFSGYLNALQVLFTVSIHQFFKMRIKDPSSDNFKNYRDASL